MAQGGACNVTEFLQHAAPTALLVTWDVERRLVRPRSALSHSSQQRCIASVHLRRTPYRFGHQRSAQWSSEEYLCDTLVTRDRISAVTRRLQPQHAQRLPQEAGDAPNKAFESQCPIAWDALNIW